MDAFQSKYFRVRDCNDCNMDIEKFIKALEKQFQIDFKTLPHWKELIEVMNIFQIEHIRKLQHAGIRKIQILKNIFIQNSRSSPFELSDKLARTSKIWSDNKFRAKKLSAFKIRDQILSSSGEDKHFNKEFEREVSDTESNVHPNTEEVQSKYLIDVKADTHQEFKSPSSPLLPVTICTNLHKMISSIGSNYTPLKAHENDLTSYELKSDGVEDNVLFTQTKLVTYYPKEIIIKTRSPKKQSFKLFVTNCCSDYLHIRFKKVSDSFYFKKVKIIPCIPFKLHPGLTFVLKFIYTLQNNNHNNVISSLLYFKISRNVLFNTTEEIFCIPITSKFAKSMNITVPGTVSIPAVYSWHVTSKCGYPKTIVHIKNNDDVTYNLHVRKKEVDFSKDVTESIKSVEVIGPDTDSLIQRIEDKEVETQSKIWTAPNTKPLNNDLNDRDNSIDIIGIIVFILNDIIDLALEPFIFKQTYLQILPRCSKLALIYFTKVHQIGCHQNYYELIFSDSKTDDITVTKAVKVFAEVLPHPIIIQPTILDMTKSTSRFGYRENYFTIINSHKTYPVTIRIKTTAKMKKIFKIIPMELLVLPKSSANFKVQICSKNCNGVIESEYSAYFTVKILTLGHKSVYHNVPPLFYEIIAPCATEFSQVYGKKYFNDSE